MKVAATSIVVSILIAGCAGGADEPVPLAIDEPTPVGALVTESLGGVDGQVFDESLLPVPNATVNLTKPTAAGSESLTTSTGVDGRFAFSLVEPGTYRLIVNATSLSEGASFVKVGPAEISKVQVILLQAASVVPYQLLYIKTDQMSCSAALLTLAQGWKCEWYTEGRLYGLKNLFEIPSGWKALVTETVWQGNEYLTDWLWVYSPEDGESSGHDSIFYKIGRSPMRGEVLPEVAGNADGALCCSPPPASNFTLNHLNQYAGFLADEANQTLSPVCREVNGDRCGGVGYSLDLRYNVYLSVFVNGAPDDLAAFTALPDE